MSGGSIDGRGGRLNYEVKGVTSASPVVLLHAGTLDSSAWDEQMDMLASLAKVGV